MRVDVRANTLLNCDKLLLIRQCLENIRRQGIPGDTAELGVYRGGGSKLICTEMPDRTHYVFDTFSGLKNVQPDTDGHDNDDFNDVDFSAVKELLCDSNIIFKVGQFPETVANDDTTVFSFVHLDADTYKSTLDGLRYFYPRLSPGGFIVLDDYKWPKCPGVELALAEFMADKPEKFEEMVPGQVVICKQPHDTKFLKIWFDHGLGDCVHMAHALQLYRQRNYLVSAHFDTNKQAVWRSYGIPLTELHGSPYHHFVYAADFNLPLPEKDWSGNKLAFNLTQSPLPNIKNDDIGVVWEELVAIDESARIASYISPETIAFVDNYLTALPRPITLLHSNGTNWAGNKNIPTAETTALYSLLLDGSPGSVILLDWDFRVPPPPPSCRLRQLLYDLGHIDVETLIALISRADLLIGIDSGPLHLALATNTPVLGVMHHFYPSCVTLPRDQSAFMTRNAPSYKPVNQARRKRWSILEYGGTLPSAQDIAKHALRMLLGPRYLSNNKMGRDIMLQQFVLDWSNTAPPGIIRADRNVTMDWVLRETSARFATPNIVETGCQRSNEDWTAGCSTYIFGAYLDGLGRGQLNTVDISATNLATAKTCCEPWNNYIFYHESDSVQWLTNYAQPIDVLYLDSLDADQPAAAPHGLAEFKAALPKLHARSIVIVDDTLWVADKNVQHSGRWQGKGAEVIPYALQHGWQLVRSGYQVVLIRSAVEQTALAY